MFRTSLNSTGGTAVVAENHIAIPAEAHLHSTPTSRSVEQLSPQSFISASLHGLPQATPSRTSTPSPPPYSRTSTPLPPYESRGSAFETQAISSHSNQRTRSKWPGKSEKHIISGLSSVAFLALSGLCFYATKVPGNTKETNDLVNGLGGISLLIGLSSAVYSFSLSSSTRKNNRAVQNNNMALDTITVRH